MNGHIEDHRSLGMETSTSVMRTHPPGEEGSPHRQPQHIEGQQGFEKSSGDQEVSNSCCSSMSQFDVHDLHSESHHLSSDLQDDMAARRYLNNRHHHRRPLCLGQQRIFSLVATAAALLLVSPSIMTRAASSPYRASSALFVPPRSRTTTLAHSYHFMSTQKRPKQNRPINNTSGSWSNAVRQKSELDESRFGVRNRVKSVLKKAKKRTGIENASAAKGSGSPSKRSGASIIAETASIGAWDVDVAIDMVSNVQEQKSKEVKNGKTQQQLPDEMTPSEPKYEDAAILSKLANEITGSGKNGVKVNSASSANVTTESSSDDESPEDDFVVSSSSSATSAESENKRKSVKRRVTEKDAFTGDVSAAFSLPREPLPFELPSLDTEQYRRLMDGERVQYQDDMGRAGSGFVVWDVKAPSSVVWDCLLDFQSYPQTIPTVREVVMYTNTHLKEDYRAEKPIDFEDGTAAICKHGVPSVTRAQFALSKFKLKIAAVHKYRPHPKGDYMIFTLDPASSNMALKYAKGIWYTESNPDGKEGHTRVWLLCELRVSRLLPQWIVDYAASRAMPRATTWLKPQVEAAAQLWLRDR